MRKLISCMHVSLDNMIAGPNGEMNWIALDDELFDYTGHMAEAADAAIYGRGTYGIMEPYWPTAGDKPDASKHDKEHSAWYNNVHKYIISSTLEKAGTGTTTIIRHDAVGEVKKLKEQEGKNIMMFGSPGLVASFTQAEIIDEYWLFVNPVILGVGRQLFTHIDHIVKLKLTEHKLFKCGAIGLHYVKA
jgi:dihydrofolate reductase